MALRSFDLQLRLAAMYNVLIVDEEEHLLWALEKNLFPDRDDIQIRTATNGEDGFEGLKRGDVDLLISDIKMPGKIDGFQLILRAKEIAPDARVVIMTAFGTNRIQNFADRIGVTHYIEKPFNVSELRDVILEILDEREGFQGVLSDLELTDIIQMLCLAKRTALLHLKHKSHRGKIVFEKGDVTHAEFDGTVGAEAVYRMLALRQGDIFMQSDFELDERTIEVSWQDLLFEGVKLADENRANEPDDEEDDDNTDLGMGISEDDVNAAISGEEEEEEAAVSFFSDEELKEIERASEGMVEEGFEPPPSNRGAPTVVAEYGEIDDDEVSSVVAAASEGMESDDEFYALDPLNGAASEASEPFDELSEVFSSDPEPETIVEPSQHSLPARDATSPADRILTGLPPKRADLADSAEYEFRGPFTSRASEGSGLIRVLSDSGFKEQLQDFARDCPGLRITGIVDHDRAMALDFVELQPSGYDADAIAVFFADVVQAANRTVAAIKSGGDFSELQLAFADEFVILRRLQGTPFIHIAVVDRNTSLGVALVMMRRFQKSLVKGRG